MILVPLFWTKKKVKRINNYITFLIGKTFHMLQDYTMTDSVAATHMIQFMLLILTVPDNQLLAYPVTPMISSDYQCALETSGCSV